MPGRSRLDLVHAGDEPDAELLRGGADPALGGRADGDRVLRELRERLLRAVVLPAGERLRPARRRVDGHEGLREDDELGAVARRLRRELSSRSSVARDRGPRARPGRRRLSRRALDELQARRARERPQRQECRAWRLSPARPSSRSLTRDRSPFVSPSPSPGPIPPSSAGPVTALGGRRTQSVPSSLAIAAAGSSSCPPTRPRRASPRRLRAAANRSAPPTRLRDQPVESPSERLLGESTPARPSEHGRTSPAPTRRPPRGLLDSTTGTSASVRGGYCSSTGPRRDPPFDGAA